MKKTSKPIIFFGNERIATGVSTNTPVLISLLEAGYNVAAIVSNYEHGKSRNVRDLEVAMVAAKHSIPLLLPSKPKDIESELKAYDAGVGVLVAYGKIIPQSVIDIFPYGIINIHPSLLPQHRGPTPLESIILDGSTQTGVSIMELSKDMDAGPIYAQAKLTLRGTETKQQLADILLDIGSSMLTEVLPGILDGNIVAIPQDMSAATYDMLITKEDGLLDWQKPAEQLAREIRAYEGWPKSRTTLGGKEVVITKAHAVLGQGNLGTSWRDGKNFGIYTSRGVLAIDYLKPAGKQEMTVEAFLAGYNI